MRPLASPHFLIYAQDGDHRFAIELKTVLEDVGIDAASRIGFRKADAEKTELLVYPDGESFRGRKYGWIPGLFLGANYRSDQIGRTILLVSSADSLGDPGRDAREAVRQYLRIAVDSINPATQTWLKEGIADYFAFQDLFRENPDAGAAPDLAAMRRLPRGIITDPELGDYAASFVAYLVSRFGDEVLKTLIESGADYESAIGEDFSSLRWQWVQWLVDGSPGDPRKAGPHPHDPQSLSPDIGP